jgi:hypothetical protein
MIMQPCLGPGNGPRVGNRQFDLSLTMIYDNQSCCSTTTDSICCSTTIDSICCWGCFHGTVECLGSCSSSAKNAIDAYVSVGILLKPCHK